LFIEEAVASSRISGIRNDNSKGDKREGCFVALLLAMTTGHCERSEATQVILKF